MLSAAVVPVVAARILAQSPVIRPVDDLTVAYVTHEERGDLESIAQISGATPTQYDLNMSSSIPNAADPSHPKMFSRSRTIRRSDDSLSHRLNIVVSSDDPSMFPGSTIIPSRAMLSDLTTTGRTSVVIGDAPRGSFDGVLSMFSATRQYYRGDLTRAGRTTVTVLVNGTPTPLPAIEAKGHLSVGGDTDDVDVFVLDNPAWPLALKWSSQGRSVQVTEIEWPLSGTRGAAHPMHGGVSSADAAGCRTEVHGIFFAFGSAELAPASDVALASVATLLTSNPSWIVTIEGHTDSIGGHAANLDLSKRRAAAVREALISRFHIAPGRLTSAGLGDTRPVTTNATIDGRARNRRVELARKC